MKETSRFRFVFFSESSAVTRRQEFDEAMEQFKVRALGNLGKGRLCSEDSDFHQQTFFRTFMMLLGNCSLGFQVNKASSKNDLL